ncbi:hypothetical protein BBJ28_00005661 [Nothophytophthora sp. Chile5]|nr:hypothetical protein BBJ28_00005661 [Nothophytophthora sp. Chile5]
MAGSSSTASAVSGSSRSAGRFNGNGSAATSVDTERTFSLDAVDSHAPRGRVQVSDQELRRRAQRSADAMLDLRVLASDRRALAKWKRRGRSASGFTTFSRHVEGSKKRFHPTPPTLAPASASAAATGEMHQVLAMGELPCSLEEAERLLSPAGDADYNAALSALYKKDYIYGSVVHVAALEGTHCLDDVQVARLAVKTATFVRSSVFAQNEQWCFLELFRKYAPTTTEDDKEAAKGSCFLITRSPMNESELTAGKVPQYGRISHLHGVTTAILVEALPSDSSQSARVRVLAFAEFSSVIAVTEQVANDSSGRLSEDNKAVTPNAARKRLLRFAKAASRLPDVVRRRRFGAQTLADRSAFEATNSRCICCTKSLVLRLVASKKKRCHLCGYAVCDRCWSVQQMENRFGQVTALQVCTRCLEFVDGGEYTDLTQETLGPVKVQPDKKAESVTSPEEGSVLATLLQEAIQSEYYATRKKSVMTVIKHLVGDDQGNSATADGKGSTALDDSQRGQAKVLHDTSSEEEYLSELRKMSSSRRSTLPLEQCVLANASGRTYPLKMPATVNGLIEDVVPTDDAIRVAAIEKGNFLHITDTDELDLICSLAARELGCSTSLVTIVGREEQLILASNIVPFRKLTMPRGQSFCQHTIMNPEPLMVQDAGADVRFRTIAARHANPGVPFKFYCGFPILGAENAIVGSFCCLDTDSREITQAQYTTMKRLAITASKVVQLKGRDVAAGLSKSRARVHA